MYVYIADIASKIDYELLFRAEFFLILAEILTLRTADLLNLLLMVRLGGGPKAALQDRLRCRQGASVRTSSVLGLFQIQTPSSQYAQCCKTDPKDPEFEKRPPKFLQSSNFNYGLSKSL